MIKNIFYCPICKSDFSADKNSIFCEKNHCFDIASEGYVNLLPVQKMNSKNPGDNKEMVNARRNFLEAGYYEPLKKAVCEIIEKYLCENGIIFDCGCGEGYYTSGMAFVSEKKGGHTFGADISKTAIKKAAKTYKNVSFAVASAYDLPIKSESIDILTDIFSPLSLSEFRRVLKQNGYFLYVVPAEKHLFEMKKILYENPYENEYSKPEYEGFCYEESVKISFEINISEKENIMSLFSMTPYLWRTPQKSIEKLSGYDMLSDTAEFYIHLLKKQ